MAGDRIVHAKCVGAEPKQYQGISGWALLFESDELENGKASKVFWMSPDLTAKAKSYWTDVLKMLGFDPAGKTAEEWSRIGSYVTGTEVVLVMEMKEKNGRMREVVKFINAPGGRGGSADLTETCNAAASLFGGAQSSLPLGGASESQADEDSDVPF
jgi:hypothetical protein